MLSKIHELVHITVLQSWVATLMEVTKGPWWSKGLPRHRDATEHLSSPHLLLDLQNEISTTPLRLDRYPPGPVLS